MSDTAATAADTSKLLEPERDATTGTAAAAGDVAEIDQEVCSTWPKDV